MRATQFPVVLLLFAACGSRESASPSGAPTGEATAKGSAAPAVAAPAAATKPEWIQDDYARALALAQQRDVPVMVELWAPWCSACEEMRIKVLHEPKIDAYGDRVVFVGIDRERPTSAPILETLHVPISPSYYVVSPKGDVVLARQLGATSAEGFAAFLDAGIARHQVEKSGKPAPPTAENLTLDGDRQALAGQLPAAIKLYEEAYAKAPAGWERLADLSLAWVVALHKTKRFEDCAKVATEALPKIASQARGYLGNLALEAEMCARRAPDAVARKAREAIIAAVDANLARTDGPPCVLERSVALQMKRYALIGLGDAEGAKRTAVDERRNLDDEAAKRTRPEEILPYRFAAVEVYAFLEAQDELVAPIQALATALPDRYHLPYMLAQIAAVDGDYEKAEKLVAEALKKAYGPQKGEVLALAATIAEARGLPNAASARKAVRAYFESLPASQRGTQAEHDALEPQ